jgi:hypothetical protein
MYEHLMQVWNKFTIGNLWNGHYLGICLSLLIFVLYLITSYLNNTPKKMDWVVLGDVILGMVASVFLAALIRAVMNFQQDGLSSVLLSGGVLTILGMGIYGLLNNALELKLFTQRNQPDKTQDIDIVVLTIGLVKPKFTRVKMLDVSIEAHISTLSNSTETLDTVISDRLNKQGNRT